jgi:hypothetical protein
MFIPIATCSKGTLSCSVEQVRPTLALYVHHTVCDLVWAADFLPSRLRDAIVMQAWRDNPFREARDDVHPSPAEVCVEVVCVCKRHTVTIQALPEDMRETPAATASAARARWATRPQYVCSRRQRRATR